MKCFRVGDLYSQANSREPGEAQLLDRIRSARSGVSDERLPELKLWLDRKWNRHQEEEDLEAGNALCELIAIRLALASSQAGECECCQGTKIGPPNSNFAGQSCPVCR